MPAPDQNAAFQFANEAGSAAGALILGRVREVKEDSVVPALQFAAAVMLASSLRPLLEKVPPEKAEGLADNILGQFERQLRDILQPALKG